jgi:integrase
VRSVLRLPAEHQCLLDLRPPWDEIAAAFLLEKSALSGSRATVETYARQLRLYLMTVGEPQAARPVDVLRFVYGPTATGRPAASTMAVRLAVVFGFYAFAIRMEVVSANPAAGVRAPRSAAVRPRGLSAVEVGALLEAIPDTNRGRLHRAMVITAVLTGLRRSELLAMTVAPGPPGVWCTTPVKGGGTWVGRLPDPAVRALHSAGRPLHPGAMLFPVSGASFYAALRRYGSLTGIGGLTPHVLRHTAAKLRRQAGSSLEEISGMLGHAGLGTTALYLRRLVDHSDSGWVPVAAALGLDADG